MSSYSIRRFKENIKYILTNINKYILTNDCVAMNSCIRSDFYVLG